VQISSWQWLCRGTRKQIPRVHDGQVEQLTEKLKWPAQDASKRKNYLNAPLWGAGNAKAQWIPSRSEKYLDFIGTVRRRGRPRAFARRLPDER